MHSILINAVEKGLAPLIKQVDDVGRMVDDIKANQERIDAPRKAWEQQRDEVHASQKRELELRGSLENPNFITRLVSHADVLENTKRAFAGLPPVTRAFRGELPRGADGRTVKSS